MYVDFKLDENGELVLTANGDLALAYGDDYLAQEILFRLKTVLGDCIVDPTLGCSLEEFIGQPNTSQTRSVIESIIHTQLTQDGLSFSPAISVVPLNSNEIFILIEINSTELDTRKIQIQAGLDLRSGLVYSRYDFR